MREITQTISIPVNGKHLDFRLTNRWSLPARDPGFVMVDCPNPDEFLFLPVSAGMWKQHELWDGTYTLDDLLDIVELIRIKRENESRAMEARA